MKAIQLRALLMDQLIRRKIITEQYGEWPGGIATVIKLYPDPEAPEIVFDVKHDETGEEIGVFDHENVQLVRKKSR